MKKISKVAKTKKIKVPLEKMISFRLTSDEFNKLNSLKANLELIGGVKLSRSAFLTRIIEIGEEELKANENRDYLINQLRGINNGQELDKLLSLRLSSESLAILEKITCNIQNLVVSTLTRSDLLRLLILIGVEKSSITKKASSAKS